MQSFDLSLDEMKIIFFSHKTRSTFFYIQIYTLILLFYSNSQTHLSLSAYTLCTTMHKHIQSLRRLWWCGRDIHWSATLAMNKMRFCIPFPLLYVYMNIYKNYSFFFILATNQPYKCNFEKRKKILCSQYITCMNITPNKFAL